MTVAHSSRDLASNDQTDCRLTPFLWRSNTSVIGRCSSAIVASMPAASETDRQVRFVNAGERSYNDESGLITHRVAVLFPLHRVARSRRQVIRPLVSAGRRSRMHFEMREPQAPSF